MRTEFIVFGLIAAFIVIASIAVQVPLQQAAAPEGQKLPVLKKAPELTGTQQWINSEPLSIAGLKGKVVLIDFWTYSCINCIRTLPYIEKWHEKYADAGLVIIGVHTPEFEFEKDYNNVFEAVKRYGLKYPIVQDNNFETWRAFENNYWPRKYMIDANGNIRYDHIGEGDYEETERAIVSLLEEAGSKVSMNATDQASDVDFSGIGTPEIYLGYQFARAPIGNTEGLGTGQVIEYKHTEPAAANIVYLEGNWSSSPETAVAHEGAKLYLKYSAKDVNIVAGGNATIEVLLDGKSAGPNTGRDGANGMVQIDGQRLYNIISTQDYGTHIVEIMAQPGFEIYTFTFG